MAKSNQTKGWLDNYNDYNVSAPEGFQGDGYSNVGRTTSPAWGGQFQMGGVLPGAVGHMYARHGAPSEGKYAKKTLPSAQNGQEMQYYQEGLDWQPKTISKNGAWLDNYEKAQDGDILDKFRESHPSIRSIQNDVMNRKIQQSKGRGKETAVTKKDNTKTVTPKEIKKLSGRQQNELAKSQSEEQARKDWVQGSMEEAYKSPLMSPGYFTPEGMAIGAMQGAVKMGPDVYEGNYKEAALDALMVLPEVGNIAKAIGPTEGLLSNAYKLNPLTGFNLKDKALNTYRIGKEIVQNPKVIIREAVKDIKKLPNQTEQIYHTFMDRNKPLYKIGSDNLENALESKIKNLQTEEGFNRLVNQELEITRNINPYHSERDLLEKANKNAHARIDELSQTENLNKSFLDAKLEYPNINVNPFLDFGIPKNNAHFRGSYNNNINLDFLKKVNKDFVLDEGAIKPGKIAIGREYAEDIGVFDHEINHALQNGRQTKIDKDIIEHFSNLENRKNGLISKKRSNNADEAALSYLLTGSKGKEPSSFLAEARRAMLNKGLINDIYDPITPDIIEKSMKYFSKNPIKNKYTKSSSTRIFDIANKNSAEFLAKQMNKLPVIAPIAGASYLATQEQEKPNKFKQGGIIKDDRGQWDHPGEITEISGDTMATHGYGDIPLYVVPDKGKPRLVQPNTGTQKFPGAKKFTEYPMAKNGVNQQDQKTLQHIDQLTNFTNYNTKQSGGWLDQY